MRRTSPSLCVRPLATKTPGPKPENVGRTFAANHPPAPATPQPHDTKKANRFPIRLVGGV